MEGQKIDLALLELKTAARWAGYEEISPEALRKKPAGTDARLYSFDRFGVVQWLDGIVAQSGKKKVFSYRGTDYQRSTKEIRGWPRAIWTVYGRTK